MSMLRNLFVDDERTPPPGMDWEVVKTAGDAYSALSGAEYAVVSLDYVLIGWESGFDVVWWMHTNNRWPTHELRVHSSSYMGRAQIIEFAQAHAPKGLRVIDASAERGL